MKSISKHLIIHSSLFTHFKGILKVTCLNQSHCIFPRMVLQNLSPSNSSIVYSIALTRNCGVILVIFFSLTVTSSQSLGSLLERIPIFLWLWHLKGTAWSWERIMLNNTSSSCPIFPPPPTFIFSRQRRRNEPPYSTPSGVEARSFTISLFWLFTLQ